MLLESIYVKLQLHGKVTLCYTGTTLVLRPPHLVRLPYHSRACSIWKKLTRTHSVIEPIMVYRYILKAHLRHAEKGIFKANSSYFYAAQMKMKGAVGTTEEHYYRAIL